MPTRVLLMLLVVGFAALGFGLFSGPVLANLYVEDQFGLDAFERGTSLDDRAMLALRRRPARG